MSTPIEVPLDEMLEAIERTKGYDSRGKEKFDHDFDTRELIIHHLEHLSASADQAPQRLKKANPLVPWADPRDLRTKIIHQYMEPDPDAVWSFARDRLPELERLLKRFRAKSIRSTSVDRAE